MEEFVILSWWSYQSIGLWAGVIYSFMCLVFWPSLVLYKDMDCGVLHFDPFSKSLDIISHHLIITWAPSKAIKIQIHKHSHNTDSMEGWGALEWLIPGLLWYWMVCPFIIRANRLSNQASLQLTSHIRWIYQFLLGHTNTLARVLNVGNWVCLIGNSKFSFALREHKSQCCFWWAVCWIGRNAPTS